MGDEALIEQLAGTLARQRSAIAAGDLARLDQASAELARLLSLPELGRLAGDSRLRILLREAAANAQLAARGEVQAGRQLAALIGQPALYTASGTIGRAGARAARSTAAV
ncbi:MAG TPA: hypothetical protein VM491_03865 [Burkholderiaceae bacterium]|nr:hypothetical protein [Burkholderiaceae bacterium]